MVHITIPGAITKEIREDLMGGSLPGTLFFLA